MHKSDEFDKSPAEATTTSYLSRLASLIKVCNYYILLLYVFIYVG